MSTGPVDPARYNEGYWERGEGSNYRGYGDDAGWEPIAKTLWLHVGIKPVVVELGCAEGYFVLACRRKGMRAVGVDVSEYAIAHAPEEVKPFVHVASCTDIRNMSREKLDAVVSWELLEHLTDMEIDQTLTGAWNALKPGGQMWHKIALETDDDPDSPVPFHDAHGDDTHISLWPAEQWREVFEDYGFIRVDHAENMLNNEFRERDWFNRFFCYRKPLPGEPRAGDFYD